MKQGMALLLLLIVARYNNFCNGNHPRGFESKQCAANTSLPMWSWGFARLCCDVFPQHLGRPKPVGILSTIWPPPRSFFEHGDISDPSYFHKHPITSGNAVYVQTADFPMFLEVFLALPESSRIVLVSGAEDIGIPVELFNPNRPNFFDYKMSALWPKGQKVNMRQFLEDKRLVKWFVQNLDVLGCNANTCSPLRLPADEDVVQKLVPIPIGLDLHSIAEKDNHDATKIPHHICEQRLELDRLEKDRLPFDRRPVDVVTSFDCNFDNSRVGVARKKTRGEICELLKRNEGGPRSLNVVDSNVNGGNDMKDGKEFKRREFWKLLGQHAFALAPAGFGTDTHRLWEILHMGAIPITLTSTLDSLYKGFPVVVLNKWSELFEVGALERFKIQMKEKFGAEPFNEDVRRRLSMTYWTELVQHAKSAIS